MKKILGLFIVVCSVLFGLRVAKAETFVEGNFINGEYINKVRGNKTYYMTMQFIKDSKGRIVYCLEPFVDFKTGQSYIEYYEDLTGYGELTKEQKRKIELIIYYGYGYGHRVDEKWYVITQYLIWKTVDSGASIYFTNTLNGKKITKYELEIEELLGEVSRHDEVPSFVKEYELNYKDYFEIKDLNDNYEIINSDYEYKKDNEGLKINEVYNSGNISVRKNSNYYDNKVVIYDSKNSQDLIRPGNVNNYIYDINLKVKKGDITLDIRDDDSVYTVESSFNNTCYEIKNNERIIDKVCTGDDSLVYKTLDLPYGIYTIEQISYGKGYKKDNKTYKVEVGKNDTHPKITLYNQLIKNEIEIVKYACKNNVCGFESGALFEIRDINGNVVDKLTTQENGYSSIVLGYGSYNILQLSGLEEYTLAPSYKEKIVDELTEHKKELYNYFIEIEDIPLVNEVNELPPLTSVDKNYNILFNLLTFLLVLTIKLFI